MWRKGWPVALLFFAKGCGLSQKSSWFKSRPHPKSGKLWKQLMNVPTRSHGYRIYEHAYITLHNHTYATCTGRWSHTFVARWKWIGIMMLFLCPSVCFSLSLSLSIYISGTLVALYLPYPFINHCENEDLCQNWDHADFHWNFARVLPRKQYSRVQVLHLLGLQVHTVHAWITKLVEDVTCICASLGHFHKAAHLASFRTFGCVWVCRCSKN